MRFNSYAEKCQFYPFCCLFLPELVALLVEPASWSTMQKMQTQTLFIWLRTRPCFCFWKCQWLATTQHFDYASVIACVLHYLEHKDQLLCFRLKQHLKDVFWDRDRRWVIVFPEGGFYHKRVESSQRSVRSLLIFDYLLQSAFPLLSVTSYFRRCAKACNFQVRFAKTKISAMES